MDVLIQLLFILMVIWPILHPANTGEFLWCIILLDTVVRVVLLAMGFAVFMFEVVSFGDSGTATLDGFSSNSASRSRRLKSDIIPIWLIWYKHLGLFLDFLKEGCIVDGGDTVVDAIGWNWAWFSFWFSCNIWSSVMDKAVESVLAIATFSSSHTFLIDCEVLHTLMASYLHYFFVSEETWSCEDRCITNSHAVVGIMLFKCPFACTS